MPAERIAIIGTGIAGLGCAHFLHRTHEVTLFEQNLYAGGHSNTVDIQEDDRTVHFDTGFMVFNRVTYPHLTRLFDSLAVPVKPTSMSFSVRDGGTGIEYSGSSVAHLFAQRRNLFRPKFIRMLMTIQRFNKEATEALDDPEFKWMPLAEYVRVRGYGDDFLNLYLTPMSSAVWSTPPEKMLAFPVSSLLRFFHNHGFLGMHTQHPWFTVDGGSRQYVERLTAPWRSSIRLGDRAVRVRRSPNSISVTRASGETDTFDRVILATHADQALSMISNPTADELRLLSEFRYQSNLATVHTDEAVMPRTRRAWASWNYQIEPAPDGRISAATHYWMNSLQGVSDRKNYFVSINRPEAVDPCKVLQSIPYTHPLFSIRAVRAQEELPRLNRDADATTRTYFAGSYFRYGFHEDAFASAVALCGHLLGHEPWTPAR